MSKTPTIWETCIPGSEKSGDTDFVSNGAAAFCGWGASASTKLMRAVFPAGADVEVADPIIIDHERSECMRVKGILGCLANHFITYCF